MATTDYFEMLRPTCYFIQDRVWFEKNSSTYEKLQQVFRALNEKVSWEMVLCVPGPYAEEFQRSKLITNQFIEIRSFDGRGLRSGRLGTVNSDFSVRTRMLIFLWNRSLLYPPLESVASTALFELIRTHPLRIDLVGLDMTMGRDLALDASGSLGYFPRHFYGKFAEAAPNHAPTTSTAHAYIYLSKKFHLFHLLSEYARGNRVPVLNRTADTLLDSFPVSRQ